MLIAATDRATVLVPSTDDRSRVRSAIDGLTAQTQKSDMTDALKLAGAVAARQANSAIWLLSDRGVPGGGRTGGYFAGPFHVRAVGRSGTA